MAQYTKNLNLEKPAQNEFYDIDVQNQNMDIIDEEIQELKDKSDDILKSVPVITNNRTDFQEGEDLNDFLTVGCFRSTTNARTRSLLNCPTDIAFTMDIVSGTGWHNTVTADAGFIIQKILDHGGNMFIRPIYASNGSIFFGEWNKFIGTYDKPTGTYSGNGNATSRTISTGGVGKVVLIFSGNGAVIVTPYGGFAIDNSGAASFLATSKIYANETSLIIATDSVLVNGSGKSYPYYVL